MMTSQAERGPLARIIDTVGYVAYDEDTLQHVHSRVDGWIESLVTKAAGLSSPFFVDAELPLPYT